LKKIASFDESNFIAKCKLLAKNDPDLQSVIQLYGYPPLWKREQGFETLIHIILEQQVSLASAKAALDKLKEKLVDITPENLLLLTDEELKACYFSRQKIIYSRELARVIQEEELILDSLSNATDEKIRETLTLLKGIGHWTVDVYLMMALQRSDLFPTGDIALIKSIKEVKQLPADTSKEAIIQLAEKWRPNRTIAAFILWHAYLSKRKNQTI
jgi:DNA-3-methyladenine glycosylase II